MDFCFALSYYGFRVESRVSSKMCAKALEVDFVSFSMYLWSDTRTNYSCIALYIAHMLKKQGHIQSAAWTLGLICDWIKVFDNQVQKTF